MKSVAGLLLTTCLILFISHAFAGAWVQKKNGGYTQLSFTFLRYHKLIDGNRLIDLRRTISDHTLQFYSEYGITDKLTFAGIFPYKLLKSHSSIHTNLENHPFTDTLQPGTLNGFSNIKAGLKYGLISKNYVLSAQVVYGAPSVQFERFTGLRTGFSSHILTPSLLFGKGSEKQFFSSELGFQLRTNQYAQNLIFNTEYGYKILKSTWIIGVIDAVIPVTKGTFSDSTAKQTGLYVDNQLYVGFGAKINHSINERFGVNIAGYGSLYTRQVGAALTLNFGFSYQW